ncbi:hypothetical protein PUN4_780042 [Paraburkholderia unamae]|nr:hypothetical protein PUN4_780042 [Paraburkholderia unamae]
MHRRRKVGERHWLGCHVNGSGWV